jgi:hypothetical protein
MESVQSYLEKVREHTEDPDHLRANEALASLVEGRTSPADTAKIITATYSSSLKLNQGVPTGHLRYPSKFHEFWAHKFSGFVAHYSNGEAQERLIGLLAEIARQPDLRCEDGSVVTTNDGQVYWRDLPGWTFHFPHEGLSKTRPDFLRRYSLTTAS